MLPEGHDLVEGGGHHKGQHGVPEGHKNRPAEGGLPVHCRKGGHAGRIHEHKKHVGKSPGLAVKQTPHDREDAGIHLQLLSRVFLIRVHCNAQRIQEGAAQLPGFLRNGGQGAPDATPEGEGFLFLCRFVPGGSVVFGHAGIERVDGAYDRFLGKNAGKQADHARPVFLGHANGAHRRHNFLADFRQYGVFGILVAETAVRTQRIEKGEDEDDRNDDLASPLDEGHDPLVGAQAHRLPGGQMVGRQLHDKGRGLSPQQRVLQNKAGQNRHGHTDQIDQKHDVLAASREKGRGKQRIDRQSRAAGHEGVHADGHEAVALALQCAGGHDGRHVAAKTHQHGHKCLARQTDHPHEAVHDKGRAGHVTGIFQKGQAQKHEENGRHKGGYRLDTAANAIRQDNLQPRRRMEGGEQFLEAVHEYCGEELVEEIDEDIAHIDGDHEGKVHGHQKEGNTPDAAEREPVDFFGERGIGLAASLYHAFREPGDECVACRGDDNVAVLLFPGLDILPLRCHHRGEPAVQCEAGDRRGFALQELERHPVQRHTAQTLLGGELTGKQALRLLHRARIFGRDRRKGQGIVGKAGDRRSQIVNALALAGRHGHNRAAQPPGQLFHVNVKPAQGGHIHHVEGHQHLCLHFQKLRSQVQVALDVGGVHDVDDEGSFAGQHEIARHLFVQGRGGQRIDARRVHQLHVDTLP